MKIAYRFGHNEQAIGAVGLVSEVTEDRKYGAAVAKYLALGGAELLNCTPGPCDTNTDLVYGVNKANEWGADLFLSFHCNAFVSTDEERGSEAVIMGTGGQAEVYADRIQYNIAQLGFCNRGTKVNSRLYELRNTNMPAVIIEPFFVDSKGDVDKYNTIGYDRLGKRIAEAVLNKAIYDNLVIIPAPVKSGTAIVYGNDVDKMACEYMNYAMPGSILIDGNIPTDYSKYARVICVGGIPPYFGKWTSYATDIVSGADRIDTLLKGLKIAGRL